MKVLIVEDDADMRRLLKIVVESLNAETQEAEDGETAIRIIENGDNPDLVLLDLHLPNVSGDEVLDKIREHCNNCIVVVVTADVFAASGFIEKVDGVFTKPFKTKELLVKISSLLGRRA
ncbi:MAG TPA: response regulator [Anaerolineales bacterium]|nr:response regulator [Anaerolineales bacterium]